MRIIVVIPCYRPDEKLLQLILDLHKINLSEIILVNDGSEEFCNPTFAAATDQLGCILLSHPENLGKGMALKTGFAYILENFKDDDLAIVCADCDGQHTANDIKRIGIAAADSHGGLIMGCRNFSENNIPLRSRIGNKITRSTFKFFCGVKVSDTQTGLRGFDRPLIKRFMRTKGARFEYEMNMLIDAKENNVPIIQVPISTIYINGNETSKFSVFKDSLLVYRVFLKFMLISLSSLVIDCLLFTFVLWLCQSNFPTLSKAMAILISTISSRFCSSLFNYTFNKKTVFNSKNANHTFVKYYILCGVQMLLSATLVSLFSNFLPVFEVIVKLFVDTLLFFLSFVIQREWVFKKN